MKKLSCDICTLVVDETMRATAKSYTCENFLKDIMKHKCEEYEPLSQYVKDRFEKENTDDEK